MQDKTHIRPNTVQETLVIPLYARRLCTELYPGLFSDPASVELVFDATNSDGLKYTNRYVKKTGNTDAMMHFALDDPKGFAEKAGEGAAWTMA